MNFKININLNDTDYINYNTFVLIKSPYGKKKILKMRISAMIIFLSISFFFLFIGAFSTNALLSALPSVIFLILYELFLNPILALSIKNNIKSDKSSGKTAYSPVSEIEFYNDKFIESTHYNKTEEKYSVIERVSVITENVIYIHVNSVMSYILPYNCFESKEQYNNFLDFIKTKCENIDTY